MSEFKVGDKVVCDGFCDVISVLDLVEDRLVVDTGIKTTPDSENTMVMALPCGMFRHATPEEIAAGHRIDNCKAKDV